MIRPICDIVRSYAEQEVDLITYTDTTIISAIAPNQYTRIESGINRMEIYQPDDLSPILISRSISCLSQDPQMSFRS